MLPSFISGSVTSDFAYTITFFFLWPEHYFLFCEANMQAMRFEPKKKKLLFFFLPFILLLCFWEEMCWRPNLFVITKCNSILYQLVVVRMEIKSLSENILIFSIYCISLAWLLNGSRRLMLSNKVGIILGYKNVSNPIFLDNSPWSSFWNISLPQRKLCGIAN